MEAENILAHNICKLGLLKFQLIVSFSVDEIGWLAIADLSSLTNYYAEAALSSLDSFSTASSSKIVPNRTHKLHLDTYHFYHIDESAINKLPTPLRMKRTNEFNYTSNVSWRITRQKWTARKDELD